MKQVDLYAERYDRGLNIFTGEKLSDDDREQWEKLQPKSQINPFDDTIISSVDG